jgi:hypothetical protein
MNLTKMQAKMATEEQLFYIIHQLGYQIWSHNHNLADGRFDKSEVKGIEEELIDLQDSIEFAVDQTKKFGIKQPRINGKEYYRKNIEPNELLKKYRNKNDYQKDKLFPSQEYRDWYDNCAKKFLNKNI